MSMNSIPFSVIDNNGAANSVVENASIGTVVGVTALASDADATTSGITYFAG